MTKCPECWSFNTEVLSVSDDFMSAKFKCNSCDIEFISHINKENNMISEEVNHPKHYANGMTIEVECNMYKRWLQGDLSDAFKYIWRAGEKDDFIQDLKKALWYLKDAQLYGVSCKFNKLVPFLPKDALPYWKYNALSAILTGDVSQAAVIVADALNNSPATE